MREGLRFPPKVFQREGILSQIPLLKELLCQEGVRAAWLLGSVLNGKAMPGSDLDIAIQGEDGYDWPELYGKVYQRLSEFLQADNIDLIILNEAPPSLRIRASRDGLPLHASGEAEVFLRQPLPLAKEPPPVDGATALTILGEALQGLRGRTGDDPQLIETILKRGIRAAFAATRWVMEG